MEITSNGSSTVTSITVNTGKVLQKNEFVRILLASFCCWRGLDIVDNHSNSHRPSRVFTFSFAIK